MVIYVFRSHIVMHGKAKDLISHLNEMSKSYHTLQELIIAHLH